MFGRHSLIVKLCGLICFCLVLGLALVACGTNGNAGNGDGNTGAGDASGNISTPTPGSAGTPTQAPGSSQVPLAVTSVGITVSPVSLSSYACGANLTVTYTATFHFPANNAGGPVAFEYTTNNGRASTQANLTVQPGQKTAIYHFVWSGPLPADHTEPEPGGVIVTSPSSVNSPLVGPTGSCSGSTPAAFKVTSIELSASPSLNGHTCGSAFKETYTAVFHIAPNSPGGTITFQYTTNNGRSSSPDIHLHVAAGQTTVTYKFYWQGNLPADHTAPGTGIVFMSAPNQGESPSASPTGQCS